MHERIASIHKAVRERRTLERHRKRENSQPAHICGCDVVSEDMQTYVGLEFDRAAVYYGNVSDFVRGMSRVSLMTIVHSLRTECCSQDMSNIRKCQGKTTRGKKGFGDDLTSQQ